MPEDEATGGFYFFEATLVYPLRPAAGRLTLYFGGCVREEGEEGTGLPCPVKRFPGPYFCELSRVASPTTNKAERNWQSELMHW